jgi:arginyl-tRNA--protein-N-Asp/Glu arginylyltransferase
MKRISLYLGHEHDCSYLPGRMARSVYVDPDTPMNEPLYSALLRQGFRRSGELVYRPHCLRCSACIPVRVPARRFAPDRCQARALKRNADLTVTRKPSAFDEAHYRLFSRYLEARHGQGGMASSTREEYIQFLAASWVDTSFVEFRLGDELLVVAVTDYLQDALSAVYTFFDPDHGNRSLGVHAVLWQIEEARRLDLSWLYLGFWIEECRKMGYKDQYRPLQALIAGQWLDFGKGERIQVG